MVRKKITDKIDDMKKHMDQLTNQLKALEDRHREEKRKADLRRNILAGELVLKYRDKNPEDNFSIKFGSLVEEHVKRPKDRVLFGLEPLENTNNEK